MQKVLITTILLLSSCAGSKQSTLQNKSIDYFKCPTSKAVPGASSFQQIGYAKYITRGNSGASRIFTYNFSKASSNSVKKFAKKLMHSSGRMTMAYFYSSSAPYIDQNQGNYLQVINKLAPTNWVYRANLFPSGELSFTRNERCLN